MGIPDVEPVTVFAFTYQLFHVPPEIRYHVLVPSAAYPLVLQVTVRDWPTGIHIAVPVSPLHAPPFQLLDPEKFRSGQDRSGDGTDTVQVRRCVVAVSLPQGPHPTGLRNRMHTR